MPSIAKPSLDHSSRSWQPGLLVAALVALGSGCSKDSKPSPATTDGGGQKTDEELLQGTWAMVSFERDGRKEKDVAKGRVIIQGDKLTLGAEGEAGDTSAFRLFSKETPKGIDLVTSAEPKAVTLGIYKLEGDSLTLCIRGRGGRKKDGTPVNPIELIRPNRFSSEDGNILIVLTRKKA